MDRRVSIIVTCFEQARWIVECLDGVRTQTHTDWELIIVDDQSTDDTVAVVRGWLGAGREIDARLVVNPRNLGLTPTLNLALTHCTGTFVAYCGGDDVWHADLLAKGLAAFDVAAPSTAFVYADARLVDDVGAELAPSHLRSIGVADAPVGDVFDRLIRRNFVIPSGVLYRRTAIEEVGGWDPDLFFEDWDLLLRLAERYPVGAVDEPLVDYRVHADSMGRRRASPMVESRLRLLSKWVGRDDAIDAHLYAYLQEQSWRLFKVHPTLAREHVVLAYARRTGPIGKLRRLIARWTVAERAFECLRRITRPFRRTGPRPRSA